MNVMIELLKMPFSWRSPEMPGYGTFPEPFSRTVPLDADVARGFGVHVANALTAGYRHIDTAFTYRNQDLVGAAIKASGIPRQDIFLTSKLHPYNNSQLGASSKVEEALASIWGAEDMDGGRYLDAFLLHYPGFGDPAGAWNALIQARDEGMLLHIGVSNFEAVHLERLEEKTGVLPEINQIEFHPFLYAEQAELLDYCNRRGIAVEGYCPLAQGKAVQHPSVNRIAGAHNTTPARVSLRWCMQHGVRPIVGSRNTAHMHSNAEPYDFTLSSDEMLSLNSLGDGEPTRIALKWNWNPKTAPFGGPQPRRTLRSWLGKIRRFTRNA